MTRKFLQITAIGLGLAVSQTSAQDERGSWPDLPEGTRAVVLVTGGDFGYYHPRGCNGRAGGSLYRINFDRWLAARAPSVQRIWVSTGDNAPSTSPSTLDLAEMYAFMGRVGYAVSGVGEGELRFLGAPQLVNLARGAPFPVLSANLQVHETGAMLLSPATVLQIAGTRVAFIGISPDYLQQVWGSSDHGTILVAPAVAAFREEVAKWRGRSDLVVLLSSLAAPALESLLANVPPPDFVLAGPAQQPQLAPVTVRNVPVLWIETEGRTLGRVAFGDGGRILDMRTVLVRDEFPIDPLTGEPASPEGQAAAPAGGAPSQ